MRETVLLINFQDEEKLREIKRMLLALKIRMKTVKKEEYLERVGCLAGVKGMEKEETAYTGEELEKEMMVFAGVTEKRLEQMLYLMRKSGMKRVDYKAVLTDTNKDWNILELYKELESEHRAMTGASK